MSTDREAAARAAVAAADRSGAVLDRLAALSDPTRLRLMFAVHAAPDSSVTTLAEATGLAPNTVTQSLGTLRRAGLVTRTRDGRHSRWSVADSATHDLLHHLGATHSALHPVHPPEPDHR